MGDLKKLPIRMKENRSFEERNASTACKPSDAMTYSNLSLRMWAARILGS